MSLFATDLWVHVGGLIAIAIGFYDVFFGHQLGQATDIIFIVGGFAALGVKIVNGTAAAASAAATISMIATTVAQQQADASAAAATKVTDTAAAAAAQLAAVPPPPPIPPVVVPPASPTGVKP
jgi:F0F1-type ATP synthase epsilon subunit